ncbi:MAG: DUF4112 domain-containing protein [Phenylobacterium sp.]
MEATRERAHRSWRSAERIKKLSDRLIGIGPFGLGLDGVLAWVPGANLIYSLGAGGVLIYEALHSGAATMTVARMGIYLAADSLTSEVPIIGWAVDTLFPGHLLAAKALQRDIEKRHGVPNGARTAADPDVVDLPQSAWRVRR